VIERPDTDDDVWIPRVTREGLAIITPGQAHRVEDCQEGRCHGGARAHVRDHQRREDQQLELLEIVATQWRDMERAAEEPGPFIYSMTRTTLRKIDLW
jgi:hypothetical protein